MFSVNFMLGLYALNGSISLTLDLNYNIACHWPNIDHVSNMYTFRILANFAFKRS